MISDWPLSTQQKGDVKEVPDSIGSLELSIIFKKRLEP